MIFRSIAICGLFLCSSISFSATQEYCERVFDQIIVPYLTLYHKSDAAVKTNGTNLASSVVKMLLPPKSSCKSTDEREEFLKKVIAGISDHSSRIGVLLPLTGPHASDGNALLSGMRALYPYRGIRFEDRVIVRDSRGTPNLMEAQLAEMVFKYNVSVVIGGYTLAEAGRLNTLANQLKIPALILNQNPNDSVQSHSFYVYPNEDALFHTLAGYAKTRGFKKIAVLYPYSSGVNNVTTRLKNAFQTQGIDATASYGFNPNDYSSMVTAAEGVFKIDRNLRSGEFQELVTHAKKKALEARMPFKPSSVALPPIIEVDAIFIDDNFRTVRHFAKLFKFLGVAQMNLLGTGQWRSQGLIDPWDSFLEGAAFVDYVGSYRDLPKGIEIPVSDSRFIIDPEISSQIDYKLIGHRALSIAEFSQSTPVINRNLLYKRLESLDLPESKTAASGLAFDKLHRSYWPTYLFQATGGNLIPLSSHFGPMQAANPMPPKHN